MYIRNNLLVLALCLSTLGLASPTTNSKSGSKTSHKGGSSKGGSKTSHKGGSSKGGKTHSSLPAHAPSSGSAAGGGAGTGGGGSAADNGTTSGGANTELQTTFPTAKGSQNIAAVKTIAAHQSFDGGMVMWDRSPSTCKGQTEGGNKDAVFILEEGATISNVIIGPNNGEGIHCLGSCTINNVWFQKVCEDAITFRQTSGTSYVNGGGAQDAADKVLQHNGGGTVAVKNYFCKNCSKMYRSCGNCKTQVARHSTFDNIRLDGGKVLSGVNGNLGDGTIVRDSCVLGGTQANDTSADVQTYFNLDGSAHDDKVKSLIGEGYRLISLSNYGTAPDAKYAVVWLCGLNNPYAFDNATNGIDMVVKDFNMCGSPSDRLYCVLGHENVGNQMSTIFYSSGNYTIDYPKIYESETAKRFWRPSRLFRSDDHVVTPQFVDTSVGKWVAMNDLTTEELASQIESQKQQGLHPIDLQGGGSGQDIRFAVIFAESDVPEARKWIATGSFTGFKDNAGATTAFDAAMQTWMKKNGVRQAQLAIASNGSTIAERRYTWAESDRPIVETDDVFLLASVSKIFVHAAIFNLIEAGKLNYSTAAYPLYGYNEPADARAKDITIDHLLAHTSGYNRDTSGDPNFLFREIAMDLLNGTRAATLRDVIEYQVARPLDFAPGTDYAYSNYGTMLLSYIVSNITATPYLDFLKANILGDLDVRLYETAAKKHAGDRIVQDSKYTGYDPREPQAYRLVPGPYGDDGAIKEECAGAFSLAASAGTVARFIGSHAVSGTGGRAPFAERDGTLVGARTFASSRPDVDWALTINTREYISETEFDDLRYWKIPFVLRTLRWRRGR
ncbi:pectate lyase-domain-containing protein [Colletotrichum phormii]|uniref:Probable pectate lyase F n=1 Tax=Colletotrichum phormii TaxID=359342 RepID=A0AAI9ZK93_9PEZI|nr:pectate lyase-domain-containing protein [Colletotrichum phormii]KAK1633538.1 pectate lyase-domain-containing protein [Colletotrichum phormii]